jgi:hypothetical protein
MDGYNDGLKKVLCPACGYENLSSNTVCLQCGQSFEQAASEEAVAPWHEPNENPYYPNAEATVEGTPPVYSLRDYPGAQSPLDQAESSPVLAIASLVCGIVAIVCCCLMPVAGLAGAITGIIAITQQQKGKGMAIAGVVLSIAAIVIYVAIIIIAVIYINTVGVENFDYQNTQPFV